MWRSGGVEVEVSSTDVILPRLVLSEWDASKYPFWPRIIVSWPGVLRPRVRFLAQDCLARENRSLYWREPLNHQSTTEPPLNHR